MIYYFKIKLFAICFSLSIFSSCMLNAQSVITETGPGTAWGANPYLRLWPSMGSSSQLFQVGLNSTARPDRLMVYGGGINNTYLSQSVIPSGYDLFSPYLKWQKQNLTILNGGLFGWPLGTRPGYRYLSNLNNWGAYQAYFGLKESQTTKTSLSHETFTQEYIENDFVKNAVISMGYPYDIHPNKRPRLIFEKIEYDSTNQVPDNAIELGTLTADGNLGLGVQNPLAILDIKPRISNQGKDYINVADNLSNPILNVSKTNNIGIGVSNPIATLDLKGNTSQPILAITENTDRILTAENASLKLNYLQNASAPAGQKSFLTIDEQTGIISKLPNNPPSAGFGTYWQTLGNGFISPNPYTVTFGTSTWNDIDFIANNAVYGHVYAEVSGSFPTSPPPGVGIGNLRYNTAMSIGGENFNTAASPFIPNDNTTLRLMARNDHGTANSTVNMFDNVDNIIEAYSLDNERIFNLMNHGAINIGTYVGPILASQFSALSIGNTNHLMTSPSYAISRFSGNTISDIVFAIGYDYPFLQLGENSVLNAALNEMIWDGDILPFVDQSYNIGTPSLGWANVYSYNYPAMSDRRLKDDINPIKNGLDIISKINPVSYKWKNESMDKDLHWGFIAQELIEVFPNSIIDKSNDTLSVRYQEIIPILTKALQEQQELIENQNKKIKKLEIAVINETKAESANNNSIMNKLPVLFQNTPNPFNSKTSIDYYIPEGTSQASIIVSNQEGKLVYSSIIKSTGMGRTILDDLKISQGTYLYSLYVNGILIDTKKMQVVQN